MASVSVGFLCSTMATGTPLTTNITSARLPLAGRRLEPPLSRDVQDVGPGRVEVYEPDLPVALLGLVVPLLLAA